MINNENKFVIFDLDGTLIDSYECVLRCVYKALRSLGLDGTIELDQPTKEVGIIFAKIYSLYPTLSPTKFKELFDRIHFVDIDGVSLISESVSKLIQFHDKGIKTVILTNKWQPIAEKIVSQLQISNHCDIVIGRKNSASFKRNISKVHESLEQEKLEPCNCIVYIGDSLEDENIAGYFNIRFLNVNP